MRLNIARSHRNLLRRPPKPARGNGRVEKSCRIAFIALGDTISTSQAIEWAYARRLLICGERRRNGFNVAVRRAMKATGAVRVGRAKTIGRPWIWRLPGSAPVEPDRETTEE
jgi:hypothetical protein